MRPLTSMGAAWAASVSVAFLGGCAYAMVLMHATPFHGTTDGETWKVLLFIGGATAIAAAIIAAIAMLFMAWPIHLLLLKSRRTSSIHYSAAGLIMSLIILVILVGLQAAFEPLAIHGDYIFEILIVLITGPVAMLVFHLTLQQHRRS